MAPLVAQACVVIYWLRQRQRWEWRTQLPMLIAASLATAAYGAWQFDMILLLLPFLHLVCRLGFGEGRAWRWIGGLVIFDALVMILPNNELLGLVIWTTVAAYFLCWRRLALA